MNQGGGCSVCGKPRFKKDLCSIHYDRWYRNGAFETKRRADWGQRSKHPLWNRWKQTAKDGRTEEWKDFWRFVADVGEIGENTRLRRLDISQPWGPDNWCRDEMWATDIHSTRASKAAYMREWHKRNPGRSKAYELKRRRGITIAEFDAILEAQGGVCAICEKIDPNYALAMDHDHKTDKNRGLLCSKCNRSLGMLDDDPERLDRAAAYLRKWKGSP